MASNVAPPQPAASEWETPWELSRSFVEIPSACAILLYSRLLSDFFFFKENKQGTFYMSITRELNYVCSYPLEVWQQFALYWIAECLLWCIFLKSSVVYTFCIWKIVVLCILEDAGEKFTLFESVCIVHCSSKTVINFGSWFLLQNDNTLCPRLRNAKVEDLRSLTNFFGSCTETFVLAVNILDRFLALMKVFHRFYK